MNKFLPRKIKLKNVIQRFDVSKSIIKNENHSVDLKVLKRVEVLINWIDCPVMKEKKKPNPCNKTYIGHKPSNKK